MAAGISFGQFNIVGGEVGESGPYAAVVENRAPGEARADLYVVLEPVGAGSAALCPELLKLITGQFGRPQYSLTGNLLQSLRAAQEHLRAWNKAAAPDQQVAAGASCLAIRDNVAYLAQAGPALAYLRHDGHLRTCQPLEPAERAPLGTTLACSPSFNRLELTQGDTVLLVSRRFGELVDESAADVILSLPPAEALPEIYKAARAESEFSALYLSVTGQLRSRAADGGSREEIGSDSTIAAGRGTAYISTDAPAHIIGRETPPAGAGLYGAFSTGFEHPAGNDERRIQRRRLARLGEKRPIAVSRPAVYTIAVLLGIFLTGWLGMPRLMQTGQADRFTALMQDAQKQEAAATGTADPAQKRSLLEKVQSDLVEARTLRPQAPELLSVQAQALTALQTLNQVRALPNSTVAADLAETLIAPRSILELAAGSNLYVLDESSGVVYEFKQGDQPGSATAVFGSGKVVEGIQTGQALQIAMQANAAPGAALLYILDSNRRLFSIDEAGTLSAVPLAGTNQWKGVNAIAGEGPEFYVLDSEAGQIWHYSSNGGGFSDPPTPMLSKADLHDAAQISATSAVFVSTANGRLLRVQDGRTEDMKISGIDQPLVSPQPPVYDQTAGVQYIADVGNQRIVAAQGDGAFRFQYSGAVLQGLRAITLDPDSGLLYALSVQKVYAIPLH